MKLSYPVLLIPCIALVCVEVHAQLDSQRDMRNPSLAPRARVSGQSAASETPGYTPRDRQPSSIERSQRKDMVESRNLEYRTDLPEYSRERQQVRDRTYKSFRDVEFISSTLNRSPPREDE